MEVNMLDEMLGTSLTGFRDHQYARRITWLGERARYHTEIGDVETGAIYYARAALCQCYDSRVNERKK